MEGVYLFEFVVEVLPYIWLLLFVVVFLVLTALISYLISLVLESLGGLPERILATEHVLLAFEVASFIVVDVQNQLALLLDVSGNLVNQQVPP